RSLNMTFNISHVAVTKENITQHAGHLSSFNIGELMPLGTMMKRKRKGEKMSKLQEKDIRIGFYDRQESWRSNVLQNGAVDAF
ncbi:hypothetical protein Bpfe_018407, partial [Biomphalaria pfeifferi]